MLTIPNQHYKIQNPNIRKTMRVNIDSTAFHVFDVRIENKAETQRIRYFSTLPKEPICAYLEVYVPKQNVDWLATTPFSSDDILENNGTLTKE